MPAPQTIGDLITTLNGDTASSSAATSAALAASDAATAAASIVASDQTALAAGLKAVGDTVVDNGDGTFTGYFSDTSPAGYHTEVLKGAGTALPPTPAPAAS